MSILNLFNPTQAIIVNFSIKLLLIGILLASTSNLKARDTILLAQFVEQYKDFGLATYHALEACKKYEKPVLIVPEGIHHYHPDQAYEQYCRMTNNTNGLKRIAFPVVDQQQLVIEGNNAQIILHGVMMGIIVHKSSDVEIKNLSFDWETPFYVQG